MADAISRISPVVIDGTTTYTATKVLGPDGQGRYNTSVVQYNDASGGGPRVIGTRNGDGGIDWNTNASTLIKKNTSTFKKASNNQIDSIADEVAETAEEKANLNSYAGAKNKDISDGNTDSSTSKAVPEPSGGSEGSAKMEVARTSYDRNLVYPLSLRDGEQDNLRIDVIIHQPKKMAGLTFADRPPGKIIGGVTLPVPTSINDANKTEWGQGTQTPAQIAASGAVKAFLGEGGAEEAVGQAQESLEGFTSGGGDVALKNFFTEQLTGASDLLARTEGMVMNPNMENLFKGPSLRSFSFSWKMSPRDQAESVQIMKIVRMFKQSMAPQKVAENLFLKAPNVYKLQFNKGSQKHSYLPKMKTCVLIDFGMNYTPDGSYMTYQNSSMVSYEMSMSFQEIEPIFNNDMSHTDDNIGY